MLQNYFKTAFRHLLQHKSYVFINVAGLGVGLAMCIIAYINWKFDADFDKFHPKAEQLFRVTTLGKSSVHRMHGVSPAPLAEAAKNDIAGVKDAVVVDIWGASINVGDQSFYETILFTESNFMQWFNFPLLKGEAKLDDPSTILITERSAKKYFGDENPIGRTLKLYPEPTRQRDLVVTGVLQDPPQNSSIFFDFVSNVRNQTYSSGKRPESNDWKVWRDATFLVLNQAEEAKNIIPQLNRYVEPHLAARPEFETKSFAMQPLIGMAQRADDLRWNGLMGSTPPSAVWGNIVMAILLLLTSCLNFTNTTISLAGKRIKEIGVRKVMGGTQGQLIQQLLMECFIICLAGLIFAIAVSNWSLEWYNQMWKFIDLELSLLDNPPLLWFLGGTVVITTLLAGAYPAFYMSSFNPNRIFHGSVKFGGSNLVSRILLGVQVAISLIAIVVGLAFARNAHFQQTADLGFQRTGIQAVYTGNEQTFTVLNNEIKKNPMVTGTAGVRFHIGDSCPRYEFDLKGEKHEAEYMEIGEDYLKVMDIRTLQGRAFNPDLETDYENAVMVNEKMVRDFFQNVDPIGQQITFFDTLHCTIIGVVRDFMQDSFFDPLRPLVLKFSKPNRYLYLAVKSESKDLHLVKTAIASAWKANFPTKPFDHNFQDEFLANAMEVTDNIKTTMGVLAIITLLLTITGLFALMSLNILKRMKEIAVRRVLGASIGNISYILNRNYFWIILGGILVGCGAGAWFAITLLDSIYNVHAGLSSIIMIVAGITAFLVVVSTIGIKIWQVMKLNPAEVLKGE